MNVEITIKAHHNEIDHGEFMNIVTNQISRRFDGTALHIDQVSYCVTAGDFGEYMITGWINGSNTNQTRLIVHARDAGQAIEMATAAFKKEGKKVVIVKVEYQ